jgi:hypothetical protein
MSNNSTRFIQCAIVKDNNNSTLRNWFAYQYKKVEYLLWLGIAAIIGQGAVILDAYLNGGL